MPTAVKSRSRKIRPQIKVWLEVDREHAFCSGMCRILRAVEQTGSIKEAAKEVGRSYRFVWGRLKRIEEAFGVSLVDAHVGGARERRSTLTPAGRCLVESFAELEEALHRTVDEGGARLSESLRKAAR